jgi:predicted MPP superfamily phosphohydrolase
MRIGFLVAIAVLLGLLLFLVREVRRPPGPPEWGRRPVWRKRLRILLSAVLLLIAFVVFWGFFIEPNRLIVHEETIAIDNWPRELDGLRIAVISDIHAGGSFIDDKKLHSIVDKTNQLHPELIVILGDYMSSNGRTSRRIEPEIIGAALKNLNAPFGTYSVLGNHDVWYNAGRVRAGLEQNGIKVLDNQVVQIQVRGVPLWLVGLADLWTREQKIAATIAEVPQGQPMIALTHNPDIFPRLPQRVPLLLAGHTHGGQVRFPFIGSVVQASEFGDRYERGHIFENHHHLFVTTGIGTSIVPVRFGVTPEIVLLTLRSE